MHLTKQCAIALLASPGALATREVRRQATRETEVRVQLSDQSTETGVQVAFPVVNGRVFDSPGGSSTLFETIEVSVGSAAQQYLRCQAIGLAGQPLVAVRGNNTDTTFSDADKGEWTFRVPSAVGEIICDPAFEAAGDAGSQVRVILSNPAEELGTQTVFDDVSVRSQLPPTGSQGPFRTVEISVGPLVHPNLRCQILDNNGGPILATRGENTDVTFSDAEKGPWRLLRMRRVSQIICDPNFVARPQ